MQFQHIWPDMSQTASTLLVAAAGAGLGILAGLPAPLLTGPALAVSLAGLSGLKMDVAPRLRDLAFLIIGTGIGSTVTPDTLRVMAQLPVAFGALFVLLVVMMAACQSVLQRGFGYDARTAVLAAAPGHLSFVIGLSTERGFDTMKVTVVQAVRLLALTLIVPLLARALGVEIVGNPLASGASLPWAQFAALLIVSLGVGMAFLRFRMPAALLIAAMTVSAIGHAIGVVQGGLDTTIGTVSFVVLGALIGTRFSGMSWAILGRGIWAGLSITAVASALAILTAVPLALSLGLDQATVLAAFAPGGFETMVALGAVLGANPGFVAASHVARLMFLTALIPLMLARAQRRMPETSV